MNEFKLYVSGNSAYTLDIITRFETFLNTKFPGKYTLIVVDVIENPHLAEDDEIIITPTLIRVAPQPTRRITGDIEGHELTFEMLLRSP